MKWIVKAFSQRYPLGYPVIERWLCSDKSATRLARELDRSSNVRRRKRSMELEKRREFGR